METKLTMNIISYTDPNNQKCYADVSNFVCTMTDRTPHHPDDHEPENEWITRVMINPSGGYFLAKEDAATIARKIQDALGVDWADV
jgi:hypothetical protein